MARPGLMPQAHAPRRGARPEEGGTTGMFPEQASGWSRKMRSKVTGHVSGWPPGGRGLHLEQRHDVM